MHNNSYELMKKLIKPLPGGNVVDVGSLNVNGTYRDLFDHNWNYAGTDIQQGANVDVIMPGEYSLPFSDSFADLVISGQTIEHCRNPFKLVAEMARVLKSAGTIILIAPSVWVQHRYPIDCWRFLPDGMRCLLEESGLVYRDSKVYKNPKNQMEVDCYVVGRKI